MDLLSHFPSSHHSSQSSDWTISAVRFLQAKNISLQIAKCYLSIKLICFMFLVELNRSVSKFEATKVINKDFYIFCPIILSVKGKSTTLGILQAFLQPLFERTNKRDSSLYVFKKVENLHFKVVLHNFSHLCNDMVLVTVLSQMANLSILHQPVSLGQFPESFCQNKIPGNE